MKVRNNYDECLTNLACSIRKYFDLPYQHKTLKVVDQHLDEKQPEKVVVLFLDGLGTNILERTLPEDAFLRRHLQQSITTVFPTTTAAATISMRTGLDPVEHGWVGWTFYVEPLDKVIAPFLEVERCKHDRICQEFVDIKPRLMKPTITEEINAAGKHSSVEVSALNRKKDFENYTGIDAILDQIKAELEQPGKKYIYAHDYEPDGTMHEQGTDSEAARKLIEERNDKLEKFAEGLTDTSLIIIADHGHLNTDVVLLKDYPDICDLLSRHTSIDQRSTVFKVKDGKKEEFKKLFNHHFGDFYTLYDAQDVIDSHLFGYGPEHELFRPAMGDFLAIAEKNKSIAAPGDHVLRSLHAGYHDDEIFVPVIVKYCE